MKLYRVFRVLTDQPVAPGSFRFEFVTMPEGRQD